ncbi:OmpA family protein [Verrucomicrobiaceae bacterium N1E253]|uniref:OmpA family protein n=1 Tax=Oceaniferula marina TaxID=2748318 RepID=A0A851GBV6_9BACT|nr:OmpA family protein [Oceaniferula marina]NWK54906.1 OmpA family protein [Oceaniferula marina]
MQQDYSWNGGSRGASSFRLPQSEGQGRWVLTALCVAVALHVLAFFGLSRIDVLLPKSAKESEMLTEVVRVNPVDFEDYRPEVSAPETAEVEAPVEVVPPADELEVLENLPEMDIDVLPDLETVQVPEISSAAAGEIESEMMDPMTSQNFEPELPEMGKTEDFFPRASDSQVTVDPGARMAEEYDPDAFTEQMRKGAEGEAEDGLLKDFTSLDKMANMDGNALLKSKALIGSDLLFEFNSSELRQSARLSLMKVALLIHKHPKLVCWVDGHTDLIGGQEPNMELSVRRAMSVKRWLVKAMDLPEDRVAVRGFGKLHPIVTGGSKEQQAPNRRVEIKMRKQRPSEEVNYRPEPLPVTKRTNPKLAKPETKPDEKPPVKAVLVKPKKPMPKAIPVEDDETGPRAIVEPEDGPRALVVPEDEPRALVVPEDEQTPGRAIPVVE